MDRTIPQPLTSFVGRKRELATALSKLGEVSYAAAWAHAGVLSPDEAFAEALAVSGALEPPLTRSRRPEHPPRARASRRSCR